MRNNATQFHPGEPLVALRNPEIYLEKNSTGLTPWNFYPVCSVCHSLFISYFSPSTRSSAQLILCRNIYADINSSGSWVLISCQLHDALTVFLISSNFWLQTLYHPSFVTCKLLFQWGKNLIKLEKSLKWSKVHDIVIVNLKTNCRCSYSLLWLESQRLLWNSYSYNV